MQVGKQFDALLVDTKAPDASNRVFYTFESDSLAVSIFANLWSHLYITRAVFPLCMC